MTVELITGFAGTPHIGSDDVGAFNAGLVGPGDYALATGDQLAASMSNATTFALKSGDAVLNGRHVHLTGTTTATVTAGTAGQNRNDLAVLRYTRDTSTNIESCTLVVIQGTSTTGTAADPAINTGSILDGVTTHDMPLYRIPIDGITVGTLVPLFNVLKPMKDVWDSLTQTQTAVFQTQNTGSFQMRFDPVIYIHQGSGLLYLHLPPIGINVTVESFGFMLYKSGPKPSKEIDLGFVYQHATGNFVYRCAWQTDGKISLRTNVTAGDYLQPASFIVPIPDGVTFA